MIGTTVLVGHPRPRSRTRQAALDTGKWLCEALAADGLPVAPPAVVDLSELDVLSNKDAVRLVSTSDLLVVASPTFKASYSGQLKVFLDGLPRRGLTGVVAVPMMTSADPAHAYAVELYLRPLLGELGATVPTAGISLRETDLPAVDRALETWSTGALPVLAAILGAGVTAPARRSWAG